MPGGYLARPLRTLNCACSRCLHRTVAAALLTAGCATTPPRRLPRRPTAATSRHRGARTAAAARRRSSRTEPELFPLGRGRRPRAAAAAGRRPVGAHRRGLRHARASTGPLVEKWEQWYASRPDYVARMVERSRRYLYHIVSEVQARKMPTEIALLPMVESAYNPRRDVGEPRRRASGSSSRPPASTTGSAELLGGLAARRARGHRQGARVPLQAARRFRRLAAGARRLQLGRRQRRPRRSRTNKAQGPADGLREPRRCRTRRATTCPSCRR